MSGLRKQRPVSDPYSTHAYGGWEWRVLKHYQSPANALKNPYARVFCEVRSPMCPGGELGDVYVRDIPGLQQWLRQQVTLEV